MQSRSRSTWGLGGALTCLALITACASGTEPQFVGSTAGTSPAEVNKPVYIADGPTYETLEEALANTLVVVEGRITHQISVEEVAYPENSPQFVTYNLSITSDLGADITTDSIVVVDLDRTTQIIDGTSPAISVGAQGIFLLDSGGADSLPKSDGDPYFYAIEFLEAGPERSQFIDPEGRIDLTNSNVPAVAKAFNEAASASWLKKLGR